MVYLNKKLNPINLIVVSLLIFFQLFGPRFGIIDVSLIFTFIVAMICLFSSYQIKVSKVCFLLLVVLFSVLIYTLFINLVLLGDELDVFASGRVIRLMLSIFLISIVISRIRPGIITILSIITWSIFIHTLVIALQLLSHEFLWFSAKMVGLSQTNLLVDTRAFGLASSFDVAGLYICIGMLVQMYLYFNYRQKFYRIIIFFFFVVLGVFTGRTFMIVGGAISVIFFILITLYGKRRQHKLVLVFLFSGLSVLFFTYFYPLLKASILFVLDLPFGHLVNITKVGVKGYYVGSIAVWLDFFILPDNVTHLFFGGSGLRDAYSDAGIIKIIYSIGLVGLLMTLSFYFVIIYTMRHSCHHSIFWRFFIPLLLLYFIIDLKTITIYSRGNTELLVIIFFVILNTRGIHENWLLTRGRKFLPSWR